jgi:anti-sigma factor RsiW
MIRDEALQEELTAYLDGELASDERRRVEERLARDPEYRSELQRMQRAWDLLEKLPRATVDDSFARTTIEMVAVAAADEARTQAIDIPRRRRRMAIIGTLGITFAAILGFIIGVKAWPNKNRQLLRDLPVIENLDLYRQADSIEFLRKLDASKLFDSDASDGEASDEK